MAATASSTPMSEWASHTTATIASTVAIISRAHKPPLISRCHSRKAAIETATTTSENRNSPPTTAATAAAPITTPDAVRAGSSNQAGIEGCESVTGMTSYPSIRVENFRRESHNRRRLKGGFGSRPFCRRDAAEASFASAIFVQSRLQIESPEVGPQLIRENELGIGGLPKQEIR